MNEIRSFSRIRTASRQNLAGNYMTFFLILIVLAGLSLLADNVFSFIAQPLASDNIILDLLVSLLVSFLFNVFSIMLQAGLIFASLNTARRSQASLNDIFLAFRYHPENAAGIALFLSLLRALCSLPLYFVTVGLFPYGIFSLSEKSLPYLLLLPLALLLTAALDITVAVPYSQAFFIYIDHQDYDAVKCLKESRSIMKGYKLRYLLLCLSFIGYAVLGIISLGFAFIWIIPYYYVTLSGFYMDLSGRYSGY